MERNTVRKKPVSETRSTRLLTFSACKLYFIVSVHGSHKMASLFLTVRVSGSGGGGKSGDGAGGRERERE